MRPLIVAGVLAALAALAPAGASARVLGIIYPESCGFYDLATDSLRKHLEANGLGAGELEVYVQKPSPDPMSWANALRKFEAVEADLIVVWGDALLQTACAEKLRRPLGYGFVFEPGLSACARSVTRPDANAAGVSAKTPLATLIGKARLMTEFSTVGILELPGDKLAAALRSELEKAGAELGFTVVPIPVASRSEAAAAFRAAADRIGLLLLPGCPLVSGQVEEILAVAAERRIPTVSLQPPRGKEAALLALYPSPEEQGSLLGEIAVAVLRDGAKAAPAEPALPKRIELEVNLPLARRLGLKVPMALLESATKIVK